MALRCDGMYDCSPCGRYGLLLQVDFVLNSLVDTILSHYYCSCSSSDCQTTHYCCTCPLSL